MSGENQTSTRDDSNGILLDANDESQSDVLHRAECRLVEGGLLNASAENEIEARLGVRHGMAQVAPLVDVNDES